MRWSLKRNSLFCKDVLRQKVLYSLLLINSFGKRSHSYDSSCEKGTHLLDLWSLMPRRVRSPPVDEPESKVQAVNYLLQHLNQNPACKRKESLVENSSLYWSLKQCMRIRHIFKQNTMCSSFKEKHI